MKNRSVTYRKTMKTLPLVEDPAELWRGGEIFGRICLINYGLLSKDRGFPASSAEQALLSQK